MARKLARLNGKLIRINGKLSCECCDTLVVEPCDDLPFAAASTQPSLSITFGIGCENYICGGLGLKNGDSLSGQASFHLHSGGGSSESWQWRGNREPCVGSPQDHQVVVTLSCNNGAWGLGVTVLRLDPPTIVLSSDCLAGFPYDLTSMTTNSAGEFVGSGSVEMCGPPASAFERCTATIQWGP